MSEPCDQSGNERLECAQQNAVSQSLISMALIAGEQATVATLSAIAAAAGVTSLHGRSVEQFYEHAKQTVLELQISDLADTDPAYATRLKQLWESMR